MMHKNCPQTWCIRTALRHDAIELPTDMVYKNCPETCSLSNFCAEQELPSDMLPRNCPRIKGCQINYLLPKIGFWHPFHKKNKFDSNTFHYNNFCVKKNCPETCSFSAKIVNPNFLEINILYLDYINYYQQHLLLT